ncbi:MAG TPA: hypothetical protein VKQ30_14035 [Ktedonobacterales bacterium]|nr:hypothetical protein [Ktedonobacterales bacterium]
MSLALLSGFSCRSVTQGFFVYVTTRALWIVQPLAAALPFAICYVRV